MKRVVVLALFAAVHAAIGVELKEMSITEGHELVKSYYSRLEFNKGMWGDDCLKLLPFRFLLSNGGFRYVLSEAEYHYSDGMDWFCYAVTNGTPKQLGIDVDSFWFWPYQLFLVEREGGRRDVIYYTYGKNVVVDATRSEKVVAADLMWRVISEGGSGELASKSLNKDIGGVLTEKGVVAITKIHPHLYRGKAVEIITNGSVVAVKDCTLLSSERKFAVAKLYVDALRRRRPAASCDSVLMVVGDMDGDGVCDAYVSSEAERTRNGGYWWTLYSGKSNGFADKEVVVNVQSFEQAMVPSRVNATCDSFCLVERKTGERYAIVLDAHDGRVVPMDYLDERNVVRRQRKEYGHKRVNFYTCLPSVDYRGIGDLEDLFADFRVPLESVRRLSVEKVYPR